MTSSNIGQVLVKNLAVTLALSMTMLISGLASGADGKSEAGVTGIRNFKAPAPGYLVGGQPKAGHFLALADTGVKHVINLRPKDELPGFPEETLATAAGMNYHLLPVASVDDLNLANVQALDQLLQKFIQKNGEDKVFIHCASGNRVGAMMALRSALIYGENTEAAMTLGKDWGMTSLDSTVRRLLVDHNRENTKIISKQ